MRESIVVNEWKAETRRDDILGLPHLKFPGQVPAEWVAAVEAKTNLTVLSSWIVAVAVAVATSPADFRAASGIGRRK